MIINVTMMVKMEAGGGGVKRRIKEVCLAGLSERGGKEKSIGEVE